MRTTSRSDHGALVGKVQERLQGKVDRKEVVDALWEILVDFLGSEEAALFELDESKHVLRLVASFGLPGEAYREVSLGLGLIGGTVRSGEIWAASPGEPGGTGPEADLTACIPLILAGRVKGAIAIFRRLPQKAGLVEVDLEIFECLATHAATALHATKLHEGRGDDTGPAGGASASERSSG
jgi:GAF domain-containing protein